MDFELSEEQKLLQTLVRDFVKNELMPLEKEIMSKRYYNCGRRRMLSREIQLEIEKKGRDLGLFSLYVPKEYGGAGLGWMEFSIITEELEKTLTPFEFGGDAPSILLSGNKEIIENYYLPCARGEKSYCFALSEPNAGADPAGLETMAVRQGDKWIFNGTKTWCTDAEDSDFALLFAITDKAQHEAQRTRGISMFAVDRETDSRPGYKVSSLIGTIAEFCVAEISLEDCPVPAANVVGELGDGFANAQRFLEVRSRLHHGARNLGISYRALQMAKSYSLQRITFGQPIASRQAIQWMLADSAIDIHACRWMVYHCAYKADKGERIREYAAMVKVFSDEMINRILDRAIQIYGGLGVSADLPLERFYRRARIWKIAGGPMEMMRRLISRGVLEGFMP